MTKAADVGGSFVRIVHETLGSLAAPEVREELIQSALRMATPAELPNDRAGYARFVRGPLRAVMLDKLGAEITDSIAEELEHVLRMSSTPSQTSETRPNWVMPEQGRVPDAMEPMPEPAPRSAEYFQDKPPSAAIGALNLSRVPPATELRGLGEEPASEACLSSQHPASQAYERSVSRALGLSSHAEKEALPRVFVASQSETFVKGLTHFLTPKAARIDDCMDLLTRLNHTAEGRAVIVLDCRRPSIRPIALAALADELPPNVQVILWGASQDLRLQLARFSPSTSAWLHCAEGDDLQQVAQRCESVVG